MMNTMKQKKVQQKAIVRQLTTSLRSKRKNSKSESKLNVNLMNGACDFENAPKQSKTAIVAIDANTTAAISLISPVSKTHQIWLF